MWRRLGTTVVAVPSAMRVLASRRFVRGMLALPLAVATSALAAGLAGLVLINVGYPLRQILGLGGHEGSIWASTYYDAWGGPTLAGAWAVHAMGTILFFFPTLAWAIRGLLRAQIHLTGTASAEATSMVPVPGRAVTRPAPRPAKTPRSAKTPRRAETSRRAKIRQRAGVIAAALISAYALALLAHTVGIGDNVLWLPRDFRSGVALAIVLAPVIAAVLTVRTWWFPVSGEARLP
nr:hypothetical protein [Planosporangium thailandense]